MKSTAVIIFPQQGITHAEGTQALPGAQTAVPHSIQKCEHSQRGGSLNECARVFRSDNFRLNYEYVTWYPILLQVVELGAHGAVARTLHTQE